MRKSSEPVTDQLVESVSGSASRQSIEVVGVGKVFTGSSAEEIESDGVDVSTSLKEEPAVCRQSHYSVSISTQIEPAADS